MNTQQPTIALLVMTDGRDGLLRRTIDSARENLSGNIVERWIHDDGGSLEHGAMLDNLYPDFAQIPHLVGERLGFGGAIRRAWEHLAVASTAEYVFHLEDDFTFNRPVDLDAMAEVLSGDPKLAQMALRRQPWNDAERAAGGVIEQYPQAYHAKGWLPAVDRCWSADGLTQHEPNAHYWLEHNLFFTTNPCLYARRRPAPLGKPAILSPWPTGPQSEGRYGIRLREAGYRFGFWGRRDDAPWVTHIGDERVGHGY